jgi:hypothetical protein
MVENRGSKFAGFFLNRKNSISKSHFLRLLKKKKQEMENATEKNSSYKKWVKGVISIPSKLNLFIIICFNLILFCVYLLPFKILQINSYYFDITQVSTIIAGLMTLVLGLLIFSAESLRDKYSESHSVLLIESKIAFITVTSILHLIFTFVSGLNGLIIFVIVGLTIRLLYSFYTVISLLTDKSKLANKRKLILSNQIIESVKLELDKRLGNNILIEFIETQKLIYNYSYFSPEESDEFYIINATTTGTITDINLQALVKLSELIVSLCEKQNPNATIAEETQSFFNAHQTNRNKAIIHFNKLFFENVNEYSNQLFRISKKLIDEESFEEVKPLALKIFKIENKDNFNEVIKTDMMYIKDEFITAIRNGHTGKIESLRKTYIFIAEEFLKTLKSFGGIYSSEQARNERNGFNTKFEQLNWLSDDLRDILKEATNTNNELIIRLPMYIPTAITNKAILYNDHLLFQEFVDFSKYLYFLTESVDFKIKKFIVDRISMHIRESMFYFYIGENRNSFTSDIIEYSKYFQKVLQDLLKSSYDNLDEYGFSKFLNRVHKLNDRVSIKYNDVKSIEIVGNIQQSNLVMLYGLKSWILWGLLEKRKERDRSFFDKIKIFETISLKDFIGVFLNINSNENDSYWGRSWWEFENHEEETVLWSKVNHIDKVFFVYQCLVIISSHKSDTSFLSNSKLFIEDSIIFDLESEGGFRKIVSDFKSKFNDLNPSIDEETIEVFLNILDKALEEYQSEERKGIREKEITIVRIEAFKNGFVNGFNNNSNIRDLFKYYTCTYNDKLDVINTDLDSFMINEIVDKRIFFSDFDLDSKEVGRNYGFDLAKSEDNDIIKKIILSQKCSLIDKDSFEKIISNNKDLFVVTNLTGYHKFFSENDNHTRKWEIDNKTGLEKLSSFEGYYNLESIKIPIFKVNFIETDLVFLFDKNRFGSLEQYSPLTNKLVNEDLTDIFGIRVDSYSKNKALITEIIDSPPDWLTKKGSVEDQINFLKENVRVMISEIYEFKLDDNFVGYVLPVDK